MKEPGIPSKSSSTTNLYEGETIRLGVSQCLLGDKVRYDGGHARNNFVSSTLEPWVEFVPVCPEVESGMPIPRPTIRLVNLEENIHLISPSTNEDFTDTMNSYSKERIDKLKKNELDGFILKKSSPSCGMARIKVYREGKVYKKNGVGVFANNLMSQWPNLPVEEEGRLNDLRLRENFISRIFNRSRWRVLTKNGINRRSLISFHTAHKLLLLSHNETKYRKLGSLVGSLGTDPDQTIFNEYEKEFHAAFKSIPTTKKHINVMLHALGHLKTHLKPKEKKEILTAIEDFRSGFLPLLVPLNLIAYNTRIHNIDYLLNQIYFSPHPKELMLRNHA